MPLYDFECDSCGTRMEHYFGRLRDAEATSAACSGEGCGGIVRKAALDSVGPVCHETLERYLERARGHMPNYRPPPLSHTRSGAGIRRWPGKD